MLHKKTNLHQKKNKKFIGKEKDFLFIFMDQRLKIIRLKR